MLHQAMMIILQKKNVYKKFRSFLRCIDYTHPSIFAVYGKCRMYRFVYITQDRQMPLRKMSLHLIYFINSDHSKLLINFQFGDLRDHTLSHSVIILRLEIRTPNSSTLLKVSFTSFFTLLCRSP